MNFLSFHFRVLSSSKKWSKNCFGVKTLHQIFLLSCEASNSNVHTHDTVRINNHLLTNETLLVNYSKPGKLPSPHLSRFQLFAFIICQIYSAITMPKACLAIGPVHQCPLAVSESIDAKYTAVDAEYFAALHQGVQKTRGNNCAWTFRAY